MKPLPLLLWLTAACCCFAASPSAKVLKPKNVKISMKDGLRFDPPRFTAEPGQEVHVSLENLDSTHQQHNFLVLQPGRLKEVVQQSLEMGAQGPPRGFIPDNPGILVHSEILDAEKKASITFTMPSQKGIYPFVCSMPGHGMIMYGAIYCGVRQPNLNSDPNIPAVFTQPVVPGAGKRPYVQRIFMPDAGPASIAVALPGKQNYCWDAGQCRLRYAWKGDFINAAAHWNGNGRELAKVPATAWWTATKDTPGVTVPGENAKPKFLGYQLHDGLPEFHYRIGAVEIWEKILPAPQDAGLVEHFRVLGGKGPVHFSAASKPAEAGPSEYSFTLNEAPTP